MTNVPHHIETDLQSKSIDWFLYDREHQSIVDYKNVTFNHVVVLVFFFFFLILLDFQ